MQPNPSLLRAHLALSGLIAGIIVVLAFLAGRYVTFGDTVIETHGIIGDTVFLLAVINLGLSLLLKSDGAALAVAGMIALLTFTQIGLGYVGRDTLDAAALHIPNGVLLMGLSGYQYATLRARAAEQSRADRRV